MHRLYVHSYLFRGGVGREGSGGEGGESQGAPPVLIPDLDHDIIMADTHMHAEASHVYIFQSYIVALDLHKSKMYINIVYLRVTGVAYDNSTRGTKIIL